MMKLTYVTGNQTKINLAKQILEPLGIQVLPKKIDCPEIQANTIKEVAVYSSKYASEYLKTSVLKNDSGLIIPALNGFPGPYTAYVEQTITEDGILKLMEGHANREAYFIECLAYAEYGKEPIVFISKTEGIIATDKSGDYGWSYDKIFIPKGHTLTLANFDDDQRIKMWSNEGYTKLAAYLKGKKDV
ncbi:MAG: non-canonical purine NTP pyrophosphatase [Bacilli bacterium]|nr:non-canonical purine NTP pyrophosphatase [Bacilli bacterium]